MYPSSTRNKLIYRIKILIRKYHLPELTGIVTALIMAVVSCIPLLMKFNLHQLALAGFFLMVLVLRLGLFVWNQMAAGTGRERLEQAKMMLVSSIVLLLMQSTCLTAIVYQLLYKTEIPIIARMTILVIFYGVYAIARIVLSVRGMLIKRRTNLYEETLSYINWISALYALALFTNYILISENAYDYNWPRYIMIATIGITMIILGVIMMVKAIAVLRKKR